MEILEASAYSEAEMLDYDRYWDQVRRDKALIEDLDEAHAQLDAANAKLDAANARADAAMEKLRQDKFDTAWQMKADGMAVENIAKYTGLSTAVIDSLN